VFSGVSKREKMSSVFRVMLVKSWGESSVDVLLAILASSRDSARAVREGNGESIWSYGV
jgi:hypothetical protein